MFNKIIFIILFEVFNLLAGYFTIKIMWVTCGEIGFD